MVLKHKERSQTVLLQIIAAAAARLAGEATPFRSRDKTYLLQVIAGRFSL